MAGILKEGPIRKRLREQGLLKRSPEDEEAEELPLEKQVMVIEVNPHATYIPTARWSRDHEEQLKTVIESAVKGLGYPGKVRIIVSY